MPSLSGLNIVNAQPGDVIAPSLINTHSALTVPPYKRAVTFLSDNLASFGRSVHLDGGRVPHRLDRFLRRRPNAYQTGYQFWRTLYFHAVHYGNGYARIVRPNPTSREIDALDLLMPEDVTPFRYEGRQWYYHAPRKEVVSSADVLHVYGLGYDGMVGYSPVALMAETFQRAKTLDAFAVKYLQRGTVIRGSIEISAGASEERQQQIVDTLRTYFRGPESDRDVIVLSDGAKLNNATLSPQEGQLTAQVRDVTRAIAQLTGVPPQFLYDFGESKYNNSIEQMGLDVVRFTFRPWIELIEDELTGKLLTDEEQDAGHSIKLNPDALLRGDTKTQSANVIAEVNGGLRTPNEGRDLLGLPRDENPDSDKLRTPHAVASAPKQEGTSNAEA